MYPLSQEMRRATVSAAPLQSHLEDELLALV
jgi:hypothetical protein